MASALSQNSVYILQAPHARLPIDGCPLVFRRLAGLVSAHEQPLGRSPLDMQFQSMFTRAQAAAPSGNAQRRQEQQIGHAAGLEHEAAR